jgi:hypothetical protein
MEKEWNRKKKKKDKILKIIYSNKKRKNKEKEKIISSRRKRKKEKNWWRKTFNNNNGKRRRWWWRKRRTKKEKKEIKRKKRENCFLKSKERAGQWIKNNNPRSSFGLVWFGFIPKWPKQPHPQLVHGSLKPQTGGTGSQFCENKGWNEKSGWMQITDEKTKKGQSRWKVRMKIITGKKTGVQTSFLI